MAGTTFSGHWAVTAADNATAMLENMDNLSTMNENALGVTEEKAYALNAQAWELRKSDVMQAYKLAEEGLALSRTLLATNRESPVYKQEVGIALLTLSICEFRLSGWAPALAKAQEALQYFEEIGDDTFRVYCMENMVRAYGTRGDFTTALELAYKSLDLTEKTGDLEAKGRVMNMLGVLYWHTGDYDRALGWYQQSLDVLRESGNRQEISEVLNNLGLIYTSLGDENKAFEYCLSGLLTKKELDDRLGESHALLNIGNLYMGRNEPDRALAHYLECLYIQEEIADKDGRAHTLTNLSRVHLELGDYGKALEYASQCLELARESGNRRVESYALYTFGTLHEKQEQFDMALEAYAQSLAIRREIKYRNGEITSLLSIGSLYTRLGNINEAASFLLEALSVAGELNAKNRLLEVHEKLADMYEHSGNIGQALDHYKLFAALQKEVFNEQSSTQLKNLQVLYEMEQATKEAEIYRLENIELAAANNEIRRQKQRIVKQAKKIDLVNKELQRKNTELESLNRDKDEFFGITVHGLNTPISSIMLDIALLKASRKEMQDEEVDRSLDQIEITLERMSDTVRKLLRSNAIESTPLDPRPESLALPTLVAEIADEYRQRTASKSMEVVLDSIPADVAAFADPAMTREIVDNLLSNAVKFSPPGTTVYINISGHTDEQQNSDTERSMVRLTVRDEGPGINDDDRVRLFGKFERLSAKPTGGEHSTGLGLSIVKKLAEGMQGDVWYESSDRGATFVVVLPAAAE